MESIAFDTWRLGKFVDQNADIFVQNSIAWNDGDEDGLLVAGVWVQRVNDVDIPPSYSLLCHWQRCKVLFDTVLISYVVSIKSKLWGQYLLMRGYNGPKYDNRAEPHIYAWPWSADWVSYYTTGRRTWISFSSQCVNEFTVIKVGTGEGGRLFDSD